MKPSEVTQPGYYWMWCRYTKEWTIEKLYLNWEDGPLMVRLDNGSGNELSLYQNGDFEFIGPLEPPSL